MESMRSKCRLEFRVLNRRIIISNDGNPLETGAWAVS
jgi:hypothetical protein